jgi:hypothetical protein
MPSLPIECPDARLLVAYTLACSLGFTGIATHEWLGIGLGVVLLIHLTLHWDWVIRTTRKLLRRGVRDRFVWLVNLLLLSMTLCRADRGTAAHAVQIIGQRPLLD